MGNVKVRMTNRQIAMWAYHTASWCNAVLIQANRFAVSYKNENGLLPWEDGETSSIHLADKMFLITSIHHAVEHLDILNTELIDNGDHSLQPILDALASESERKHIKEWRNMNEHSYAYITKQGHKQDEFISTVEKNGCKIKTNAHITFVHRGLDLFLIGDVDLKEVISRFKLNLPQIQSKMETIFYDYFIRD